MSDLISREALVKRFEHIQEHVDTLDEMVFFDGVLVIVENAPAVDAEPVKHAAWESEGDGYFFCKGCKKYIVCIGGDADLNYCPNCGARMDEEVRGNDG